MRRFILELVGVAEERFRIAMFFVVIRNWLIDCCERWKSLEWKTALRFLNIQCEPDKWDKVMPIKWLQKPNLAFPSSNGISLQGSYRTGQGSYHRFLEYHWNEQLVTLEFSKACENDLAQWHFQKSVVR